MTIANININGHTYTDAMWRADWEGTISGIANDIADAVAGAALVGGTLHKVLTGSYTLTAAESLNRVYVYSGSLGGAVTVAFDVSFRGLAFIKNTTNQIVYQAQTGLTPFATIPAGGSMLAYSDGVGVYNTSSITQTGTGSAITGTLTVSNGMTVTGSSVFNNGITVTGNSTFNNDLGVVGLLTGGTVAATAGLSTAGYLNVTGVTTFSGQMNLDDNLIVTGDVTVYGGEINTIVASGEARHRFSTPNAQSQWLEFQTTGTGRWLVGKSNHADIGSNKGSNFQIVGLTDAGEGTGMVVSFEIFRENGHIKMFGMPSAGAVVPAEGPFVLYYDAAGFVKVTGV